MTPNQHKIIEVMRDALKSVDEKCDGYREELTYVIAEILEYENAHKVAATDIQKKINGKLSTVAKFLAKERNHKIGTEDQTP